MKKAKPKPLRLPDLPLPKAQIEALKSIAQAAGADKNMQLCLFIGPSGTGKTLVAQVLANELKRPLQRMKLPALVGESDGETERNLTAILAKAGAAKAILFFDEADALFGKRSEVKDSHDRYANQEVGHLLSAVEAYRGLVILGSNIEVDDDSALAGRPAHVLTFARQTD